ncbi:MAG: aspartate/glutamate racemase family protein [Anaerolineales bacterium]
MYQFRDLIIKEIKARPNKLASGMGLGILLLDDVYPAFPGDVRNPSAYPFPIQYEIVEGVDIYRLVRGDDKSSCLDPILTAAKKLERIGCKAIVGECGYFAFFQKEVASAIQLPVFMSSLLQVPFAQQIVGDNQIVGILAANSRFLSEHHLVSVGIQIGSNYVIGGAMDDGRCPELDNLWTDGIRPSIPQANYEKAEAEFLAVALEFYEANPNMGAMVLECTGFPPFARALQRLIDIPIFSWGTLLDYAYSVVVHRDYYGHV